MIQKEEYLKALDVVEQYHKQLEFQIVSGSLDCEVFSSSLEAVNWVNRNKDKTLVTITSEQYGVTVYYR